VAAVSFGPAVVAVAAVAGDEGLEDDGLSVEGFDGSGEWTAKMGWMMWRLPTAAAADLSGGGGRD